MKWAALVGASVLLLAACGESSATDPTDQITAAYRSFFPRKGSLDAHVALVQNGMRLRPLIKTYLHGGPSRDAWVSVTKVTMQGTERAEVIFTLHSHSFVAPTLVGGAVLQGGTWKLTKAAICQAYFGDSYSPAACK
jgi:hypothetical protein